MTFLRRWNEEGFLRVYVPKEGRMNPLIYVALVLGVSAIAVTVYAFLSAPEGFEDERGFHAIRSHEAPPDSTASQTHGNETGAHPFLSAP